MGEKKKSRASLTAPLPITPRHVIDDFRSGDATLDEWLRRRAMRNEQTGASRTYVVCHRNKSSVVAYYCLAVGAVARSAAAPRVRRNMPQSIPVILIGRLAVDERFQGRGIGRALVRDAILRSVQAADIAGVRALLVHALSKEARRFYESCGFRPSPVDSMMLMITIDEAKREITRA